MSPARYAAQTSVPVERTKSEIERLLNAHGADEIYYGSRTTGEKPGGLVQFAIEERRVSIFLPLPASDDHRFTHTDRQRRRRTPEAARKEWEQACRQSWRALLLVIKAKLESVVAGISTLEREFLADFMLPDGETVSDKLKPFLDVVIATGRMPKKLTAGAP